MPVNVNPVTPVTFHTVPVPVVFIFPVPNAITRVFTLAELKEPTDRVTPLLIVIVPAVNV